MASPGCERTRDTRKRLESCWELDLTWEKYPSVLREGCSQVGRAMSVPPAAILGGLLILTSFIISPSVISVPGTDWIEPALIWLTISMPTGSRKTTIYQFLRKILQDIRHMAGCTDADATWILQDATFEKMGALMAENGGRQLALFDELSAFLIKIKLYSSRGLTDSHELAMFLELYNANPWTRTTVTGDANFSMKTTSLTVGGFNQPSVARSLIELPGNAEKGLSQRFLWLFPRPVYGNFDSLETIDSVFTGKIVETLASFWKKNVARGEIEKVSFSIPEQTVHSTFKQKYDLTQKRLQSIAAMDDLLSGMLSKSMGQTLRTSAAMHVLFSIDEDAPLPSTISNEAINAAIDFVEVCCQHTAYITGRGLIHEEVESVNAGSVATTSGVTVSNEAYVLTLSGKYLDVSALVNKKKKFRFRGGKDGALKAMKKLEESGLGTLIINKSKGSVKTWFFHKTDVPNEKEGKLDLAQRLSRYGVSLQEYLQSVSTAV